MKLLNPVVPPQTVFADHLNALVLDWAGTTVDFGSVAPARTMERLFSDRGILLNEDEIRRDMGLPKREHIRAILSFPRVRQSWLQLFGVEPGDSEVDEMYAAFIPMQLSCLAEYSSVIPGVAEAVAAYRARGLKIGSTSGYTREMLDQLLKTSAQEGYIPDCSVAPSEVGSGRPQPFMIYECAIRLQVYPMCAIAKVGDTPADIEEGLNAGAWTIGVAGTGNGIGVGRDEFLALPVAEREARLARSRRELENAGAHFVVDSVVHLDSVVNAIDSLLAEACTNKVS